MKAVAIETYGGQEVLKVMDLPKPEPQVGEVLIRIKAAAVNPVDAKIRQGLLKDRMPNQFPITIGWDAAGVVEQARGDGRLKVGDAVYAYCRKAVIHDGTYAEYIAVPESSACAMPPSLSFEEAAAVPLAGLTAYQCLEAGRLQSGQVVLVHGCAGGVGGFAVQIARNLGARVIGTASANHHDHARSLGVEEVIDYNQADFVEAARKFCPQGIDLVFDTVGGDVQVRSADAVRQGGHLVSILAYKDEASLQKKGIETHYVFVAPNAGQLATLGRWIDQGLLRIPIAARFAMQDAAKAHAMIETRHTAGKIVLLPME
jgi:NADPH:quinone reductase-like Zn-dependent oxidoreductase